MITLQGSTNNVHAVMLLTLSSLNEENLQAIQLLAQRVEDAVGAALEAIKKMATTLTAVKSFSNQVTFLQQDLIAAQTLRDNNLTQEQRTDFAKRYKKPPASPSFIGSIFGGGDAVDTAYASYEKRAKEVDSKLAQLESNKKALQEMEEAFYTALDSAIVEESFLFQPSKEAALQKDRFEQLKSELERQDQKDFEENVDKLNQLSGSFINAIAEGEEALKNQCAAIEKRWEEVEAFLEEQTQQEVEQCNRAANLKMIEVRKIAQCEAIKELQQNSDLLNKIEEEAENQKSIIKETVKLGAETLLQQRDKQFEELYSFLKTEKKSLKDRANKKKFTLDQEHEKRLLEIELKAQEEVSKLVTRGAAQIVQSAAEQDLLQEDTLREKRSESATVKKLQDIAKSRLLGCLNKLLNEENLPALETIDLANAPPIVMQLFILFLEAAVQSDEASSKYRVDCLLYRENLKKDQLELEEQFHIKKDQINSNYNHEASCLYLESKRKIESTRQRVEVERKKASVESANKQAMIKADAAKEEKKIEKAATQQVEEIDNTKADKQKTIKSDCEQDLLFLKKASEEHFEALKKEFEASQQVLTSSTNQKITTRNRLAKEKMGLIEKIGTTIETFLKNKKESFIQLTDHDKNLLHWQAHQQENYGDYLASASILFKQKSVFLVTDWIDS